MALDLHADCLTRLRETLAEGIRQVRVTNGKFLDYQSLAALGPGEAALPGKGKSRDLLTDYIGESPLISFVSNALARGLRDQEYQGDDTPVLLTALDGFDDTAAIADRVVREFESLPWDYRFTLRLKSRFGHLLAERQGKFEVNKFFGLTTPDDDFRAKFPFPTEEERRAMGLGDLLTFGLDSDGWGNSPTCLHVSLQGFVDKYGTTAPVRNAIAAIKAFVGLGIALRMLVVKRQFPFFPGNKWRLYVHRLVDEIWRFESSRELDAGMSAALGDLEIFDPSGHADTDEKKVELAKRILPDIASVFQAGKRATNLLRASEWLFDSYCGENQLLSFVQTMVAMEILLGDNDKENSDLMGLSALLRNRCAYLIGYSSSQRDEILDDFKRIYEIRSKIVHRGQSHLGNDELNLFWKLQWMCHRVIQEEVRLLKKDT